MSDIKINTQENKMATSKMLPLVIGMSLPAMFSMLIQALYNVVDSMFVAHINKSAFTAVSLAFPLQLIMISFAVGTSVGVNSLIARCLGAKNFKNANSAASHGMLLAFLNWILFFWIGLFISKKFISLFTQDITVINYGTQYLHIVLCSSVGLMYSCMGEKTLQATGNMLFPMLSQTLGAVINIIFDPLLIFGIGFLPKLEVAGAAIATVFGQICSMIFILVLIKKKDHDIKISFKKFKLDIQIIKDIYVVGFPAIIMQCVGSVMVSGINAIIYMSDVTNQTAYINSFGAYFKLQSFVFMPVFGLNQGVSPVIGYNYGAKDKKRMYSAFKIGILVAVVIMSLGLLLFQLGSGWLLSLFDADEMMLSVGKTVFKIISLSFVLAAVGIMFSTLFQAVGKGFYSLLMSFCRQLIVLLPLAYFLSKIDMMAMWYAFPLAEFGSITVALLLFMRLRKKEFKCLDT